MMELIWASPLTACDYCKRPFGQGGSMVMADARSRYGWGCFCDRCIESLGLAFGIGYGQRYVLETRDGVTAWYCVEGSASCREHAQRSEA